ncbi:MAG: nicotianamine synthase family protein [Pseudomonadota bacterium]
MTDVHVQTPDETPRRRPETPDLQHLKHLILTTLRSLHDYAWSYSRTVQLSSGLVNARPRNSKARIWQLPSTPGWYFDLSQPYERLERYAGITDERLLRSVLNDPEIQSMLPALYALRAKYEYDLELEGAEQTIAAKDPRSLIASQIEHKVRSLPEAYFRVLRPRDKILFAGSGPMPTTALALSKIFGRPISCIDYDPRANDLAREYAKIAGYEKQLTFFQEDLLDFRGINRFDCVAGAFLIGISHAPEAVAAKSEFVRDLLRGLKKNTWLVLRTPRALGSIIYPPLKWVNMPEFREVRYPLQVGRTLPYDTTFTSWDRV